MSVVHTTVSGVINCIKRNSCARVSIYRSLFALKTPQASRCSCVCLWLFSLKRNSVLTRLKISCWVLISLVVVLGASSPSFSFALALTHKPNSSVRILFSLRTGIFIASAHGINRCVLSANVPLGSRAAGFFPEYSA